MALREAAMAASILLISSSADHARAERDWRLSGAQQEPRTPSAPDVIVTGRVERIFGPRLFAIARDENAADQELLVFAPNAVASPLPGSRLAARGALRRFDDAELEEAGGSAQFDERSRAKFSLRPMLVAQSLLTSTGRQLTGRVMNSPKAAASSSGGQAETTDRWNEFPITVRPGTLADLVDSLAGGPVRLANARVVGVFDARVFLVESQTRLLPLVDRNRVLVFVETGVLRVESALLVASTVTVSGVARTLIGMKTGREVPWPTVVTPEVVKRLEIRAAVLARSVRTPEGIDLLTRSSTSVTPAAPSSWRR
jgi:hypothetical protein